MERSVAPLHVSARVEDHVHRWLGERVRRRGWSPSVTASTGYGTPQLVHLFARVLLSPTRARTSRRTPRGWRSLVTVPAAGHEVTVELGGRTHALLADRGGYVHASVATDLPPGWHSATLMVEQRTPVTCRVRVVDPHATRGVICDIDDTVLVTLVPRPLLAAWNSFFLREHARRPVPGMSELLHALAGEEAPLVYVSTGAWNFASHLERFMAEHRLPAGPLILTDWGPTTTGWFRSGAAHKREVLERLRTEHPHTRWILVGDDGQRDPMIYAEFAAAHPESVEAIAIRQLTPTQQLLTTTPTTREADRPDPARTAPTFRGADGFDLLAQLRAAGVVSSPSLPITSTGGAQSQTVAGA